MWTKKGKYGLKALLHLAALPRGSSALSAEIAAAHALPQKFLEAIMLEMKNAGFVTSRKGKGGGYALAKPAEQIRIGDVVRALEGPLAPIACASHRFYRRCEDCPDEGACAVHMLTVDVRNAIAAVLDEATLAETVARLGTADALLEASWELESSGGAARLGG
jgi:Rrf2 family protein